MNGEYRTNSAHGNTAKKWFDICKNCAINRLHNQTGTNANLIFVAKAAYGMAETAPVHTTVRRTTADRAADRREAQSRFTASRDGKAGVIAVKILYVVIARKRILYLVIRNV